MAGRVRHCVVPGIISPDPAGVTMVISQTAGPGAFPNLRRSYIGNGNPVDELILV